VSPASRRSAEEGYLAPNRAARAEVRDRGSRFLAVIRAAADEEAARAVLDELEREFPDATHHCWAWRLGWPPRERSSDAGEPPGTAGVPILRALRGAGLSDAVAGVVRWFGGEKLGKGGLARAYSAATRAALAELALEERVPVEELAVEVPLARVGTLKRLLRPPEIELLAEEYRAQQATFVLRVTRSRRAALLAKLAEHGLEIARRCPTPGR
jgi:uncharacterized YigZ family protein